MTRALLFLKSKQVAVNNYKKKHLSSCNGLHR